MTTMRKVNQLVGIPLYYERATTDDKWGDLAKHERLNTQIEPNFKLTLDKAFEFLERTFRGYGLQIEGIISAGIYVDKSGAHGKGRGFDLDGLVFRDNDGRKLLWRATEYEKNPKLYLGIQSVFMQYFGVVLNWHYNEAHKDHLHIEDTIVYGFRKSKSITLYIQDVLNRALGLDLKVDGVFGKKTKRAFEEFALSRNFVFVRDTETAFSHLINKGLALLSPGIEKLKNISSPSPEPPSETSQDILLESIQSHIIKLNNDLQALQETLDEYRD